MALNPQRGRSRTASPAARWCAASGVVAALGLAGIAPAVDTRQRSAGTSTPPVPTMGKRLTHDETLRWIAAHRAWRQARKTKPILARAVTPEEVGKPVETADHATERAQTGAWLCVGSAGEPWFQSKEKIDGKYRQTGEEQGRFAFDDRERTYLVFTPRADVRNWAAQVTAPDIEGFYIQPNYPTDGPLYAPAGGYVVKDDVEDPYAGNPNDVWLVQQGLFESTYEIVP